MIDWKRERDRIDLARVATDLLGTAPGRQGERGRKLWWSCPLHDDPNPSFVVNPGETSWKCYGCGETGDAANLLMRLERLTFPEAVAKLLGGPVTPSVYRPRPRPPVAPREPRPPSGLPSAEAVALVESAEARLWSSEGAEALAYLTGVRHLAPETIRMARLGWASRVEVPIRDGGIFRTPGWVIPWFHGGRLAMVNVRRPDGSKPKYAQAFRDRPAAYPGPAVVMGRPLVVVEGEFDTLLLGQELVGLATVLTLGSASGRPTPELFTEFAKARPWFVATDGDDAGDQAARHWPPRARRVRPPGEFKDWTEARQAGVDLRRWWTDRIDPPPVDAETDRGDAYEGDLPPGPTLLMDGGEDDPVAETRDQHPPEPPRWEDLAAMKWGPTLDDPEPGLDVPANDWRWVVANWPPDRWSAWYRRAGELEPPGADADAIRAAQLLAYEELLARPGPEASPVEPPGLRIAPEDPAASFGDDEPAPPQPAEPDGWGDDPPTIEGFQLLSEDELPDWAFDDSMLIRSVDARAWAEEDRATREAMARTPQTTRRAGRCAGRTDQTRITDDHRDAIGGQAS